MAAKPNRGSGTWCVLNQFGEQINPLLADSAPTGQADGHGNREALQTSHKQGEPDRRGVSDGERQRYAAVCETTQATETSIPECLLKS